MLRKLLKYDFRSLYRPFVLTWSAALALALITRLTLFYPDPVPDKADLFFAQLALYAYLASLIAIAVVALILVILGIAAFFVYRSFQKGAIPRSQVVLKDTIEEKSTSLSDAAAQELIGLEGECLTALRPSGNADFDGRKLDVVSAGEFIEKGSRVRIEAVEGLRILVKKI